ncbi:hypothetical protein JCM3775_005608 [Rhodotorula graminis]|uniref:Chromo domain-containing protein n=1 Tax=Rhodotorula graminis (strain WP1) TaxID=578459 RepID=A0A194SB57_RHOGW|nr:uncharacterized protein RHOBADRAFT_51508 [Rhodotorula graminis WP1]KPV77690.1 hypothetical protein RHOBADRAFT_51508 [Rhodotorula graminis WP1]
MPCRPSLSARAANQDDSLVVHPATQAGGDSGELSQASSNEDDDEDGAQVDSQGFWEADAILDATATKYRISWKGTDENGEPWEPTWEPKENANAQLVQHWREVGRAEMKAEKRHQKEERQEAKKAARAARAVKTQRKKPASSTASSSRMPAFKADDPPVRSAAKRKMVAPESDTSSQSSQPLKKKVKATTANLVDLVEPQPVQSKKRVAFDLVLSGDEDELDNNGATEEHDSTESAAAANPEPESGGRDDNDEPAASSGSTTASVVPDSQAAPPLLDHSTPSLILPFASTAQTSMHSPASSHLDVEDRRSDDGDDDVAIFDPLQHNDHDRTSSHEPEPVAHLRPVPIPAVSAFQLADSIVVRSSQLDPIEDPDSSPRRSPFRRQQSNPSPRHASPRPRPAKTRLELVSADHGEVTSPLSSFELEVLSATAASYVSLPMSSAEMSAIQGSSTSGSWSHSRPLVTAPAVKRPLARAPDALVELEAGPGVAVHARVRPASPEVVDDGAQHFAPTQGGADDEERQCEFFDEIFDYEGGAVSTQQVLPTAGETVGAGPVAPQQDAGEGSAPHGYTGYGAAGSWSGGQQDQQSQQQQQQQQQPQSGASSSSSYGYTGAPSLPGGYGFGSAPGFPGSGYRPILPAPYGHPHAVAAPPPPSKRDLEDAASEANKKARTESSPQPQSYPAAAHAHSPYSNLSGQIPSPYGIAPPQAFSYSSSYGPPFGARPPALNVHAPPPPTSAGPVALASPSLARVQSQDPFGQARASPPPAAASSPVVFSTGLSSPVGAPAGAHRSPSPLPPSAPAATAAPVSPSLGGVGGSSGFISRNSSPAPGAGKADEVVALVKMSPHIVEEDGTKVEIERFLRDPKTYSTSSTAPLMRSEFWAFELRHVTVDGVDKVDFIILRTHQSTFQLKRAVVGKVPVDFARSLSHTAARPRGLTPAVEAVPTLAMSSPVRPPPPALPAPSTMTREQLEQEVERLRQQSSAHEVELVALRPLAAEVAKLKVDCQALTKTNKSLLASRESTQSDLSYMQAQYQAASGAAVERANEARVAEAEAAKLRGLLDTGLKQKELVYAGQIKTIKTEYARVKQQLRHYQEESKRTQEHGIRDKAAKWDEHVARLAQEQKDAADLAQGLPLDGVGSGDDDDDDDVKVDGVADDSEEQEPSTINTSATFSQLPSQVPVASLGLGARDLVHPLPAALDAPMPPSSAPSTNESTMLPVDEFRCEWRTGTESQAQPCGAVTSTKEGLQDHLVTEHLPQ